MYNTLLSGGSGSFLLPPALALLKALEDLPGQLRQERSEEKVRQLVLDFNVELNRSAGEREQGLPNRSAR